MAEIKLSEEKVYSPVHDAEIAKNLNDSPVWSNCFKQEELNVKVLGDNPGMYEYTIKFSGLTPVQVTKIRPYSKSK